mmetsp:Transcript_56944/g.107015  ORF Transcript_56944/g.107015 Transcript_56944/m.107015 type:complete len:518 (-) Transcript_56944:26-1579(-)
MLSFPVAEALMASRSAALLAVKALASSAVALATSFLHSSNTLFFSETFFCSAPVFSLSLFALTFCASASDALTLAAFSLAAFFCAAAVAFSASAFFLASALAFAFFSAETFFLMPSISLASFLFASSTDFFAASTLAFACFSACSEASFLACAFFSEASFLALVALTTSENSLAFELTSFLADDRAPSMVADALDADTAFFAKSFWFATFASKSFFAPFRAEPASFTCSGLEAFPTFATAPSRAAFAFEDASPAVLSFACASEEAPLSATACRVSSLTLAFADMTFNSAKRTSSGCLTTAAASLAAGLLAFAAVAAAAVFGLPLSLLAAVEGAEGVAAAAAAASALAFCVAVAMAVLLTEACLSFSAELAFVTTAVSSAFSAASCAANSAAFTSAGDNGAGAAFFLGASLFGGLAFVFTAFSETIAGGSAAKATSGKTRGWKIKAADKAAPKIAFPTGSKKPSLPRPANISTRLSEAAVVPRMNKGVDGTNAFDEASAKARMTAVLCLIPRAFIPLS